MTDKNQISTSDQNPEELPLEAYLSYGLLRGDAKNDEDVLRQSYKTGSIYRVPAIAESPEKLSEMMSTAHPGLLVFGIQSMPQLQEALASLLKFSDNGPGVLVYAIDESVEMTAEPGEIANGNNENDLKIVCFQVSAASPVMAISYVSECRPDVLPFGTVTTEMLRNDIKCIEKFVAMQK